MSKLGHWFKVAVSDVFWFAITRRWGIRSVFNDLYEGQERSETFRGIFREVMGDEHAAEADATGFVTLTDLRNLAKNVEVGPGQKLVDLACGRGGAGLWVARETGAQLVGLDISEVAIAKARQQADRFSLNGRAEFQVRDFTDTKYPDGTFDAAMSVDALNLVPDKTGSVRETARILKPNARFVFTTWELRDASGVKDYRPLLEQAGFQVEVYEPTPRWEEFQRGVHERIIARQDALIREMGKDSASVWIQFAKVELPKLGHMGRFLIAARKK